MNVATIQAPVFTYHVSKRAVNILLGTLFLALTAKIKFYIPFITLVPFTMQTFAAMMLGGFLGKKDGAISCLIYIFQIMVGLPFSASWTINPLVLVGPTGGYILAFAVQSYLTGLCFEKRGNFNTLLLYPLIIAVSLIQLLIGTSWLQFFVGSKHALQMGFYPFLPGGIAKCLIATSLILRRKSTTRP